MRSLGPASDDRRRQVESGPPAWGRLTPPTARTKQFRAGSPFSPRADSDPRGETGQQFATDVGVIDILTQEPKTNTFVVIELKKGRESDKVVGQVLRYMGWVAENLCQEGQRVRGMIICKDCDPRMSYALKMVGGVSVKYYRMTFSLQDQPEALRAKTAASR